MASAVTQEARGLVKSSVDLRGMCDVWARRRKLPVLDEHAGFRFCKRVWRGLVGVLSRGQAVASGAIEASS